MANFDVELNDEVENFTVEFGEIQRITVDDFDKLRNRPSYAGQAMTHETNIPEVPTAVSQLTNDADYQTGSEVESAISIAVGDEKDAREQADAGLSRDIGVVDGKVDAEVDARERADTALQGAIDDEETARKNADNGLQGQIDAITSSSDVVDIVGTYAELLQYSTAGLGDKDVIKVLQDETHNDAMSYYRWNKSSSTWSYIGSEGPYYTKSETNTLLGDKQDTLTAGSNITISSNNTISATDTTYTAGNGLTLTGTEFSADTTVLQPKLTAGDGITITGNTISANIDPADFFTASETVDGTGTDITLNNTMQAKLKSVQMDGDTTQKSYTGKNLIDPTNLSYVYTNSPSQIVLSMIDGGIRMVNNGGASQDRFAVFKSIDLTSYVGKVVRMKATFGANGGIRLYRIAGDGSNRSQQAFTTVSGNEISFTVPADLGSAPYLGYVLDVETGGGTTVDFTDLIMTVDAELEPFEPYVGGVPAPNPDYPQPIQTATGEQTITVRGKNLFDLNETGGRVSNATKTVDGDTVKVEATSGSNAYVTILLPNSDALLGKTCTISFGNVSTNYSSSYSPRIAVHETKTTAGYYANTTIVGVRNVSTGYNISFTFPDSYTSDNNGFVIVLYTSNAGSSTQPRWYAEFSDIQLEIGEEATTYQTYAEPQFYTVDLGSIEFCKIGDYQDYIYKSEGDWYVHKEIGKLVFDGSESWTTSTSEPGRWNVTSTGSAAGSVSANYILSDKYIARYAIQNGSIFLSNNVGRISIVDTSHANVTDWETWLSSNNVTAYFRLATPTDIKITDATLISQLDALADALGYKEKTIITVSATGTNLPAILEVSAYRNSLAGVLGVIGRAEAA